MDSMDVVDGYSRQTSWKSALGRSFGR